MRGGTSSAAPRLERHGLSVMLTRIGQSLTDPVHRLRPLRSTPQSRLCPTRVPTTLPLALLLAPSFLAPSSTVAAPGT